jgi:hypothetical protein
MTMRIEYLFLLPLLAALAITTLPVFASTGMGGDPPGQGTDNPQPDRVGNADDDNDEDGDVDDDDKDRDGPGGEGDENLAEGDDEGEANCWGKVTSDAVTTSSDDDDQDGEDDGIGGRAFGEHTSNPVNDPEGEEEDNETPREGVGNQDEDHPSDHADRVGGAFSDEECAED